MVLAPVYGWFVDRGDAYTAITTSAFLCAWGCLARGAASNYAWLLAAAVLQGLGGSNLPTLVLAHLASCTEASTRSLVVSGYAAQLALLQIGGKALYGPFDSLLQLMGFASQQLRYRITISVCMANCFFGVSQMLLYRRRVPSWPMHARKRVFCATYLMLSGQPAVRGCVVHPRVTVSLESARISLVCRKTGVGAKIIA
eukprot:3376100-Pleurochrysis_carterae.AAC.1